MSRTADYTIQGFVYQFNKTLVEILSANDNSTIAVEGIIEDVEVQTGSHVRAIQCKYHEGQETFSMSVIYKPILQMMAHYARHSQSAEVEYILFAYFPDKSNDSSPSQLSADDIKSILSTRNKDLQGLISEIGDAFNIVGFLAHFRLEFGPSLAELVSAVKDLMTAHNFEQDDIDTLFYPNAIQMIADLSIKHDPAARYICKTDMILNLRNIRTTAVTRWTKALNTFDKVLKRRRQQLIEYLGRNSRLRYLLLDAANIEDFDDCIITFISDYLKKFHFKEIHDRTPLFCIDCSWEKFQDLRVRLHRKGIEIEHGYITDEVFDEAKFLRDPNRRKEGKDVVSDFSLRLILQTPVALRLINEHKADDIFVFEKRIPVDLNIQDVNVEHLDLAKMQEIKYVLGMGETYV